MTMESLLLPLDLFYQKILLLVKLTVYVSLHSLFLVLHPLLSFPEILDLVSQFIELVQIGDSEILCDLIDLLVNHSLKVHLCLLPGGDLRLQKLSQSLQLSQHLLVLGDLIQPLLLCVLNYIVLELFVILL